MSEDWASEEHGDPPKVAANQSWAPPGPPAVSHEPITGPAQVQLDTPAPPGRAHLLPPSPGNPNRSPETPATFLVFSLAASVPGGLQGFLGAILPGAPCAVS